MTQFRIGVRVSEPLSADEERDLIAQALESAEAFRRLYRHYFPRVFAYVAYRVGRRQDAEDITADIFLRVIEAIADFEYRGDGSFAAWLFRIAHNHIQQFYRKEYRQTVIALDDLPEIHSHNFLPDDAVMRKEQFARLQDMLNTLSPRRQEIISLRFFAELRNKEIAAVLQLDERTVASHLSRGLEDLQKKYKQKDILT
jgi:RNA polymerase sigma-70 factor, ECF subfamily